MRVACILVAGFLVVGLAPSASALETDQFYAWGRPLEDATDVLNAKVNMEIEKALAEVNGSARARRSTCRDAHEKIVDRFRYPIFIKIETWAQNTPVVDRIPATPEEELAFRQEYLYAGTFRLDIVRWMPPSPTILVDGVRTGTDKLSHFFSEGLFYHWLYRKARKKGLDHEAAERRATELGILTERTVLGLSSSGVLSRADLEANYQGMRFYDGLCDADDPVLEKAESGWRMKRPFDFRDYVSPEWDESWQPSIFGRLRWKSVAPMIARYCPLLDDPSVRAQRASYAARDRETLSEGLVGEMVARGKLKAPASFSIESVCATQAAAALSGGPLRSH